MIKMLSFIILMALSLIGFAADYKIIVKTPAHTPSGDEIYLSSELCQWKADCLKLHKLSDHLYEGTLPQKTSFKVTRGSWANEAADSAGKKLENIKITKEETVLNLANWKDQGSLSQFDSHIETKKNFNFPKLGYSKDLIIYLPPGYFEAANSAQKYPVIYAHDGQNLFDPKTSTYGKSWSLAQTLDRMIGDGEIEPVIVVGISSDNTLRYDEYDFERTGRRYAYDLINTVMPYVNSKYRIFKAADKTFLMGSSMGALISFEIMTSFPESFSKAAGLSLPAFIHNRSIFHYLFSQTPPFDEKLNFYFDHGDYGIDAKYEKTAKEFYQLLIQKNCLSPEQMVYRIFPYADHTELDWARRVHIPLKYLLGRD